MATPTEANPGGEESFSIDILPSSYALLVPGQGAYLQISGLSAALIPGQSVPLTFTFADGRRTIGKVAGYDGDGDLAVIDVDTAGASPLEWGEAELGIACAC